MAACLDGRGWYARHFRELLPGCCGGVVECFVSKRVLIVGDFRTDLPYGISIKMGDI